MSCVATDIKDINLPTFLNAHIHSGQAGCVHPFAVLFLPLSFQHLHAFFLASTADVVNHPFSIPFTITSKEYLQFILCWFVMKACQVYYDLELHDLVYSAFFTLGCSYFTFSGSSEECGFLHILSRSGTHPWSQTLIHVFLYTMTSSSQSVQQCLWASLSLTHVYFML